MDNEVKLVPFVNPSSKYSVAARVYQSLCHGGQLSSKDIDESISIFSEAIELLDALGPRFDLSRNELYRRRLELVAIQRERSS